MIITRETKERFVKMLSKKQIVVIWHRLSSRSDTRNYKFIGMQNGMKWDFTYTIIEATGCKTNEESGFCVAARDWSSDYLVKKTLKSFKEEGIKVPKNVFENVDDYLAHFGM